MPRSPAPGETRTASPPVAGIFQMPGVPVTRFEAK